MNNDFLTNLVSTREAVRQTQVQVQELQTRPIGQQGVESVFADIPGLVGLWTPGNMQRSTGNILDWTGQGRTLTYNGNPTLNHFNGYVPYLDLDGTGDFLSRADENDLDITGLETVYASGVRGLTMGGWFWLDSVSYAQSRGFISKDNLAASRQYGLYITSAGALQAFISSDGTASTLSTGETLIASRWYFLWMRFSPSTYLDAGVGRGSNYTRNTTSIPASIFVGTSVFNIGSVNSDGTNRIIDGRWAGSFLSANLLTDNCLSYIFQRTAGLFGA